MTSFAVRHKEVPRRPSRPVVTMKTAGELSATEVADCYRLATRLGFALPAGFLEAVHFSLDPTVVVAHRDGRVVAFQSHSLYRLPTPFFRGTTPVFYGGIALHDPEIAGSGVGHRMITGFARRELGPFWMLRHYVFVAVTCNPRLIDLMSTQLHLYLPLVGTVPPDVVDFVRAFARDHRRVPEAIDDQLLRPSPAPGADITQQWSTLYRARRERYNELALRLGLVREQDGRHLMGEHWLYLVGRSSRLRLVAACWVVVRAWLRRRHRLAT